MAEVAADISREITRLGLKHDDILVVLGAALHDSGKIAHPEELVRSGSQHEAAGEQLLLSHGLSPSLARACRTHGSWDGEAVTFEERLIAAADHLWKGARNEKLETVIVQDAARRIGVETWESMLMLDTIYEEIASCSSTRLARARV